MVLVDRVGHWWFFSWRCGRPGHSGHWTGNIVMTHASQLHSSNLTYLTWWIIIAMFDYQTSKLPEGNSSIEPSSSMALHCHQVPASSSLSEPSGDRVSLLPRRLQLNKQKNCWKYGILHWKRWSPGYPEHDWVLLGIIPVIPPRSLVVHVTDFYYASMHEVWCAIMSIDVEWIKVTWLVWSAGSSHLYIPIIHLCSDYFRFTYIDVIYIYIYAYWGMQVYGEPSID